jgi:hypothetical protein
MGLMGLATWALDIYSNSSEEEIECYVAETMRAK